METTKLKTVFLLRNKFKKNLYCRIFVEGSKPAEMSICSVDPQVWKDGKLSHISEEIERKVTAIYNNLCKNGTTSAAIIKEEYLAGGDGSPETHTVCSVFDEYISNLKDNVKHGFNSKATLRAYTFLKKNIEKFMATQYKVVDMEIASVDDRFLHDYELYLRRRNKTGTIIDFIHKTKGVFNHAFRIGVIDRKFDRYEKSKQLTRMHQDEKDRAREGRKLSDSDLKKIEEVAESPESTKMMKANCLRWLWTRWTGMAFVDMCRFNPDENIFITKSGKQIRYRRKKTKALAILPYFDEAMAIYKELEAMVNNGYIKSVFPEESGYVTYNRYYLSKIAKLTGIEKLTSHMGRHMFGQKMLDAGFTMQEVSRMLGHKSITTTESTYARVDEDIINAGFERVYKQAL